MANAKPNETVPTRRLFMYNTAKAMDLTRNSLKTVFAIRRSQSASSVNREEGAIHEHGLHIVPKGALQPCRPIEFRAQQVTTTSTPSVSTYLTRHTNKNNFDPLPTFLVGKYWRMSREQLSLPLHNLDRSLTIH